ncbi:MAG: hypothetical protein MHPSP_003245, partial [Paramarteilia canceri]
YYILSEELQAIHNGLFDCSNLQKRLKNIKDKNITIHTLMVEKILETLLADEDKIVEKVNHFLDGLDELEKSDKTTHKILVMLMKSMVDALKTLIIKPKNRKADTVVADKATRYTDHVGGNITYGKSGEDMMKYSFSVFDSLDTTYTSLPLLGMVEIFNSKNCHIKSHGKLVTKFSATKLLDSTVVFYNTVYYAEVESSFNVVFYVHKSIVPDFHLNLNRSTCIQLKIFDNKLENLDKLEVKDLNIVEEVEVPDFMYGRAADNYENISSSPFHGYKLYSLLKK